MQTAVKMQASVLVVDDEARQLAALCDTLEDTGYAGAAAAALDHALLIGKLREAEQRYRRLADNAQDVVFRYELMPQPRFTYINSAQVELM